MVDDYELIRKSGVINMTQYAILSDLMDVPQCYITEIQKDYEDRIGWSKYSKEIHEIDFYEYKERKKCAEAI